MRALSDPGAFSAGDDLRHALEVFGEANGPTQALHRAAPGISSAPTLHR